MDAQDPFGWVGHTIGGKLLIDAVAGEGAFGVVYRATHLGFLERVAVKCLKLPVELSQQNKDDFVEMFRREARILLRLSRKTTGIVQALDVSAATSPTGLWTPYMVMEWLEGVTLAEELDARADAGHAPRSIDEALDLLAPVAAALSVAHEESVTHRDIKPANLFLVDERRAEASSGAPRRTTKIVDFGIAKVLDASIPSTAGLADTLRMRPRRDRDALATTHEVAGAHTLTAFTPLYGAPEQFNPKLGATGPWTDVFALALILLEVVAGKRARSGDTLSDLYLSAVGTSDRPTFASLGVTASAALEEVIQRALSPEPAQRIRTAGELWRALEEARAVKPPAGGRGFMAGEYRLCSILSIDIPGFAELSQRLGPEQEREVADACFAAVRERIEKMGGAIAGRAEGVVTAIFGVRRAPISAAAAPAPITGDNDAERAVRAALELTAAPIHVALAGRAARGPRLVARVGISTGRVFVSGAGDQRGDIEVFGNAVKEASRLQQIATPGTLLIAPATRRQVGGLFHTEAHGDDLSCFRVAFGASASAVASDFLGLETRFVGRAAEMDRLSDALETVVSERRASFVTVAGPGGIGRSRLLAELAAELQRRSGPCFLLSAPCSSLARDASYHLAASLLRAHFRIADDDPHDAVVRKLRWNAPTSSGDEAPPSDDTAAHPLVLEDAVCEIAGLLCASLSSATAGPARASAADEEGAHLRKRMSGAFATLFGAAAARAPVVIVLDDIHWADDASLDLFDELTARLSDAPLLVVGAARPDLYERRPHWGEGKATHARIDLGPMARRYVEEMARDRLRLVASCPASALRTLAERAEGNPLTLTETLHLLVDLEAIDCASGDAWVLHEERLAQLTLPTTIQGIVQARLDRLDDEARGVLALAAVIGRTFWKGAVEALQRVDVQGGRGSSAAAVLDRLREQQLIRARDASTFPDDREYVFAEAATQEIAYEALSFKARRELHRDVAAWLEGAADERAPSPQQVGEARAALAAMHHDRGGDARRAALAYARAAALSAVVGQNAEALRHFQRAYEIHMATSGDAAFASLRDRAAPAAELPDNDDRRVLGWQERAALLLDRGDALRRAGRLDEAERAYEEVRAQALRIEKRAGAPPLDTAAVLLWDARADFRLALAMKVRGATAKARAFVERAIGLAERGGAVDEMLQMHALLAALHRRDGELEACRAVVLRSLRLCKALPRDNDRRGEVASQLLLLLGTVFYARGRVVQAERCYRQAARVVPGRAHPQALSFALNGVAAVRFAKGDLAGARETFARTLSLKERLGDLQAIASGHNNLAEVELRLSRPHAALDHARRAVRLGEQSGSGADLPDMYRNLAEARFAVGRIDEESADRSPSYLDESLEAGCTALRLAELGGGRVYLGEVALCLSRIVAAAQRAREGGARARAEAALAQLTASLAEHFGEGELARKADECRAIVRDDRRA